MSAGPPGSPSEPTPGPEPPEPPGPPVPPGPPGSSTFSLDNRPAPGLYLAAWVASGLGVAVLFVASLAQAPARGLLLLGGLGLLLLGLSAAAGYQLVARRSRPPGAYHGPSPLILFGIWFGLVNLGAIGLLIMGLEGLDEAGPFLAGVGIQTVAYVLVVWLFVVRGGALSWPEMGLPGRTEARRVLVDAAFAASLMLPVTLLALVVGGLVAQVLDARPPTVVPTPESTPELLAVLLAVAILAPIGEELFFRGFALTAWLRDLGPRAALVRSSVFFAVIHIVGVESTTFGEGLRQALVMMSVYLPLGFLLGWLFLRRGLVAATVAHVTYNGILVVLLALATQLAPQLNQ
ncbi:MAG TPA: type II CAAX endopeptidase family protein [Candidatus Limnocylindria bacterium]|nr:type II CAAX endopeptidase family protein [Candidatus Limnocylindria bacterium]